MRALIAALVLATAVPGSARPPVQPIIDMHVHAYSWDQLGDPPPANPVTGSRSNIRRNADLLALTRAQMRKYNIVRALISGPVDVAASWRAADPRMIVGREVILPGNGLEPLESLRTAYDRGEFKVLGELGLQYRGRSPADPDLQAYWAFAEEKDIPVAIHTGIAAPGTPYQPWARGFRTELGRPTVVEETLKKYSKLRVSLMHAGAPWLEDTIAMLSVYPQVYVDLGVVSWVLPREQFNEYLAALVRAGFSKRIMFGSDQMIWPEAVGMAVERVRAAPFLTDEQRADIFYNNAARFLRLTPNEIQLDHRR